MILSHCSFSLTPGRAILQRTCYRTITTMLHSCHKHLSSLQSLSLIALQMSSTPSHRTSTETRVTSLRLTFTPLSPRFARIANPSSPQCLLAEGSETTRRICLEDATCAGSAPKRSVKCCADSRELSL